MRKKELIRYATAGASLEYDGVIDETSEIYVYVDGELVNIDDSQWNVGINRHN